MAQDTFEAAEAASRQAREERMASVGALPMTERQRYWSPRSSWRPTARIRCRLWRWRSSTEEHPPGRQYKGCRGQRGRRASAQVGGQRSLAP
jgi:hypothetical protein